MNLHINEISIALTNVSACWSNGHKHEYELSRNSYCLGQAMRYKRSHLLKKSSQTISKFEKG